MSAGRNFELAGTRSAFLHSNKSHRSTRTSVVWQAEEALWTVSCGQKWDLLVMAIFLVLRTQR